MNEKLITRPALVEDIPLIQELAEATWWPAYSDILSAEQIRYMLDRLYSAEALEEQMKAGQNFLVVYEKRDALGFASWSAMDESAVFKLHKIYVLPQAQGKGAGRLLIEEVAKKVRKLGAQQLELNVNRYNKAQDFYEKLGFKVQHNADIPIGPYFMNDYVMLKML